jgi:hypothetical protein
VSPQLTISSLFSVLALAALCILTNARDWDHDAAPVIAQQAELAPSLLEG